MMTVGRRLIGLAAAIAALSIGCSARETMNFDKIEYLIGDDPDAPDTLVVAASGQARFSLHSNEFAPDEPEIGVFQSMLPPERIASLNGILETPPFAGLPDHWKKIRPGERNRRIRLTHAADVIEKFLAFRDPIDSSMQRVLDTLDALAHDLKAHPWRALRLEIVRVDVSKEQELTVLLNFSNIGQQPIALRAPVRMPDDELCQLRFELWPDKAKSELQADDLIAQRPQLVENLDGIEFTSTNVLDLAPGETASFGVRLSIGSGRKGRYVVRAVYVHGYDQADGREVMSGELFSRPFAFGLE